MSFNLQRHCRLAGCVALFIGLYLHNWALVLFGNLIVAAGYMWTIAKVEIWIEQFIRKLQEEEDRNTLYIGKRPEDK